LVVEESGGSELVEAVGAVRCPRTIHRDDEVALARLERDAEGIGCRPRDDRTLWFVRARREQRQSERTEDATNRPSRVRPP
jgi:hypothetical protein